MKSIYPVLFSPIAPERIALFRIFFGLTLFGQALYFESIDFIQNDVIDPVLHFPYPYMEFISVLDPWIMHGLLIVMIFSSLFLILGIWPRIASLLYLLSFAYLFLLDKGYYNNHYYLICLLLVLLSFMKTDKAFSVLKIEKSNNEAWERYLLIFQFSLVLIYAGFNKMNHWWLIEHEPVHHILQMKASLSANVWWTNELIEYILYGEAYFLI